MSAHYTLIIGSKNWSSWSLRPWLVLKMAGNPFDEVSIALRRPETKAQILQHSPSGKIPALEIRENGATATVWDSLAICETLAERHPEKGLWPQDGLARAEARSICCEMHSGFFELRKRLPMEVAARHVSPPMDDVLESEIARVLTLWTSALGHYGRDGGFLFGRFSIADAFYAPVVTRFETYGIPLPGPARAYADRILALAPMRDWAAAAKAEAHAN
jgi:glutathione S-transferase